MPADTEIFYEVAGSGGYGSPAERDPQKLREDLLNGYVSEEGAARDYGVADVDDMACPHCRAMREKS